MIDLSLEWDSRSLSFLRTARTEPALQSALRKAGGDAIRFLRTGSQRLITQRKRYKARKVREGLPIFFPRGKADLVWRMDVSGEPVPLSSLPHRQTRRGVRVTVNVGRTALVPSAFVARMRSGHQGIFRRRSKTRLPIDEAFTSKLSDVAQDRGFAELVQAGAQARFSSSLVRLLDVELGRLR